MPNCDCCGKDIDNPFKCNYCGGNFCSEHRLPPSHECPGLDSWKSRSGPSIGSDEKKESWISKKKELFLPDVSLNLGSKDSEKGAKGESRKDSPEVDSSKKRLEGEVKFYNQDKNYGFIIPEDGGEDVYFKGGM